MPLTIDSPHRAPPADNPAAVRAMDDAKAAEVAAAPQESYWAQAWSVATSDQISLVAAGCAFYAMLALFPAISLCIAFYGVWFNLDTIEPFPEVTVNHLANFTCRYALPPVPFPTPSGAPTLLHA